MALTDKTLGSFFFLHPNMLQMLGGVRMVLHLYIRRFQETMHLEKPLQVHHVHGINIDEEDRSLKQ